MENFIPDIYQKNIYDIDYERLKNMGIKCLLFDLDNTLVPVKSDRPNKKLKELFLYLEKSFKLIIVSNSNRKRLIPFKEELNVDVAASILINPIGEYEKFGTKINRFFEKFIYHHLKKQNILVKGRFYE